MEWVLLLLALVVVYGLINGVFIRRALKRLDAISYSDMLHVAGLPIPDGWPCRLILRQDELVMECKSSNSYVIPVKSISGVFDHVQKQITQQQVNDGVGRAIAGGLLFGPVGAMVGASTGSRTISKEKRRPLLSITFEDSSQKTSNVTFAHRDSRWPHFLWALGEATKANRGTVHL